MGNTPALNLSADVVLKQEEIEAIVKAELERRGHTVGSIQFSMKEHIDGGNTRDETREMRVMANIRIKL